MTYEPQNNNLFMMFPAFNNKDNDELLMISIQMV